MLYTLNNSPYTCDLAAMLRTTLQGDDLILFSDGVIAGIRGSSTALMLKDSLINLHALENDIIARGLSDYFSSNIKIISYSYFIILTEKQRHQVAW